MFKLREAYFIIDNISWVLVTANAFRSNWETKIVLNHSEILQALAIQIPSA